MAVEALSQGDARWWITLDEALRQRWWWVPQWSRELTGALADGDVDDLCLFVAGCHHDGRIREASVAHLAGRPSAATVAVLALRTGDWVVQVRERARAAVEPRLADGLDAASLGAAAELAFTLAQRREGGWLADRIDQLLLGLPADALGALLHARDRRTRRAAYRAGIAAGQLGLAQLARAAIRDSDLPIRAMCARAVVDAAPDPTVIRDLLRSRTALVRAEALHTLTANGDLAVAETALADRHPLVRTTAQAALRRAGIDPAARYRALIAQTPPTPGAIAGLAETGTAGDTPLIVPHLSHPRLRGRVEAIRALRRLGATDPGELIPLLRDPSGAVTRQAVAALRQHAHTLDSGLLDALLQPRNPPHLRMAGYRLLTAKDVWLRLATNLRLIDDPDPRLRAHARADIATWLDRQAATSYRGPSAVQAAELDTLITRATPELDEHRVRLLRFHTGLAYRTPR